MIKVVNTRELHSLIPECAELDEIKFSDLKELLRKLIPTIERSGKWIFVEYIPSNSEALFIVRTSDKFIEKVTKKVSELTKDAKDVIQTNQINPKPIDITSKPIEVTTLKPIAITQMPWH